MFSESNGRSRRGGGCHQRHRRSHVCARRHAVTENFFWAATFHVSCCYGDASPRASRSAGLAAEGRGRGGQGGTLMEGYGRVRGEGQEAKIIRSMHSNPYKCCFP